MSELYTELLIKRKTPPAEKLLRAGMITVTAASAVAGLLVNPFILIVFVGMLVLDYLKLPEFDLEFEYLYINGELDIDKIISKQKRKRVLSLDMDKVELAAPESSHELDHYRQNKSLKVRDYSSGEEKSIVYALITSQDNQQEMILFEPSDVMLEDMKRIAPRKVKLY